MMYDGWGHMTGWHWLVWLVVLALIVAGMVALIRLLSSGSAGPDARRPEALDILEARYARGEIGQEEYLQRRRDITGR